VSPRDASDRFADVLVVGAGFAGLHAAALLRGQDLDVVLLEARDRVGGRVESVALQGGAALELGASWVTGAQTEILGLADRAGATIEPMASEGATVLVRDRELAQIDDQDAPGPSLGAAAAIDELDKLATGVDPAAPWQAEHALSLDLTTLGAWFGSEVNDAAARLELELAAEGYFATPAAQVPLLHALFYARANGGFDHLLGASGDPLSQSLVRGGAQRLAEHLAGELESLVLREPVAGLSWAEDEVRARARSQRIRARRAVIAMPPPLAQRLEYEPALPWERDQLTQRWSMGSGWKCHAIYASAFWRERGLNGRLIDLDTGITAFDTSPLSGSPGILSCFLPVAASADYERAGEEGRRQAVADALGHALGEEASNPEAYRDRMWWREPYSRGDVAVPALGTWSSFGHSLREPVGSIHWAGSETAAEFAGQMEGALRSGRRAAEEVAASL